MGLIESLSVENRKRLEAIATKQRITLGFKAFKLLSAKVLAEHFEAEIYTPETFPNVDSESIKPLCDSDNWSAGIIRKNPLLGNLRRSLFAIFSSKVNNFLILRDSTKPILLLCL